MPLSATARQALVDVAQQVRESRSKPLWQGPCNEGVLGGVTQSLLGRYLACKERFRINTIEGLRTKDSFNHRMEFGSMWHVAEEAHAANSDWRLPLKQYCQQLVAQYREQGPEIAKWYEIIKVQFPVYVSYWKDHPDVKSRKPLLQEEVFCVPYKLPSSRTVWLRGKFDSVDDITKAEPDAPAGIYIAENKSKGEIDKEKLLRELPLDLQANFYLISLEEYKRRLAGPFNRVVIRGIRYNVVRRPLGKGKHSIKQRKGRGKAKSGAETPAEFYKRLGDEHIAKYPQDFFERVKMVVTVGDRAKFKNVCLHPILENLCDDYEWWTYCLAHDIDQFDYQRRSELFSKHRLRHFLYPYGVYNPVVEGRQGDLDAYLYNGNMNQLQRVAELFKELK